jgi:hypothetical protein
MASFAHSSIALVYWVQYIPRANTITFRGQIPFAPTRKKLYRYINSWKLSGMDEEIALKATAVNTVESSILSASVVHPFLDSSMAERPAVNRMVLGSNPSRGVSKVTIFG